MQRSVALCPARGGERINGMKNPFRRHQTGLERFLAFLQAEASVSHSNTDTFRLTELEGEPEIARTLVSFAADPKVHLTTIEELVAFASPDHEGWGVERRGVDSWVSRFRRQDS